MEQKRRLNIILFLFVLTGSICLNWYTNFDVIVTYKTEDKDYISKQQVQEANRVYTPGRRYYKLSTTVIEKKKTNIPFIYKRDIMQVNTSYHSTQL